MTLIVNSITQKNIPIVEINKSIKINFIFDTNGEPETKGARIEATVIDGVIITDMYHPAGSKFEQSPDKRRANVISVAESSNGWGRERYVTLKFESLPAGNGKYVVGLLCYYDSNGVPGLNTPILVDLGS